MLLVEQSQQLKIITDRFIYILHEQYGIYLDSISGFEFYHKNLEQKLYQGVPRMIFSNSSPDNQNAVILHKASIADLVNRNAKNGSNIIKVRQNILVMIYHHWEEDIRKKIAEILKKDLNNVKSDIMHDIKQIRHDILKNRGRANNSVKNKIFKFQEGEQLNITQEIFELIFNEIFKYLNQLHQENTGSMPYLDNSLNLKAKEWHRSMEHVIK